MDVSKTTLLVRHLPSELDDQEKIDLLCYFGAECVKPMGSKGPMKHTAFAKFATAELAERCLKRLHQVEVLGCRLLVEFAKLEQGRNFPSDTPAVKVKRETDRTVDKTDGKSELSDIPSLNQEEVDDVFRKHNITYPKKPGLFYLYPPPTVSTLTNIANAMASHPKFYTQVLHLMNKMNLPCPFGHVTPSPPLALDNQRDITTKTAKRNDPESAVPGDIEEIEMEYSSTEESEIDSDTDKAKNSANQSQVTVRKTKRPRKRMKLVQPDMSMIIKPAVVQTPSEVFETQQNVKPAHIQFNLSEADIASHLHRVADQGAPSATSKQPFPKSETLQVVEGGFGKVEPPSKPEAAKEVQKPDVSYKISADLFLDKRKVAEGRLKEEQIKDFSVFKNYTPGEPTSRLYIKNLTKQTTEQDLVNLFGSFVHWDQELAYEAFDVRVMKEGRMKGQAFVNLPSENDAEIIVQECNGFILNNKPIVIQFARSAKAKQVDKPVDG